MELFGRVRTLFVLCFALLMSQSAFAEVKTVRFVDVGRYLGDWYQISHIPLWFEGGNCPCARQRLTLEKGGVVGVYNSCNAGTPSGELRDISGFAYNDDKRTSAKFTVDFNLGYTGTYWIVGLDPEYRYAVVTDKNQDSLYVLSKTPTLDPALLKKAVKDAGKKNLPISKLVKTVQKGCRYPK